MMKSYKELSKISSIEDRYKYLCIGGKVGRETFGFNRYLNQAFYRSDEWKKLRREAIIRDNGCDLGVAGFDIFKGIVVHHINPITEDDLLDRNPICLSLENVICCSDKTHRAIHYGDNLSLSKDLCNRIPGDTKFW